MVSPLGRNPTVAQATEAYETFARGVIDEAAARDKRLSRSEAHRIKERLDGGRFISEEAVDYLYDRGQQTVAASKLVSDLTAAFEAAAASAAGPGGRLSLNDASKLPARFRADFLYLRGQGPIDPPSRTREQLVTLVRGIVLNAFDEGTAIKLSMPPRVVRGRKELFEHLAHPASNTALTAYIANNQIYVSRSASHPTPLVGWYKVGPVPPP